MYIVTYQIKSDASWHSIFPDTLAKAKSLYTAMRKDPKVYFVVLSKAIEMNHP